MALRLKGVPSSSTSRASGLRERVVEEVIEVDRVVTVVAAEVIEVDVNSPTTSRPA
jgi:hypothetical protein